MKLLEGRAIAEKIKEELKREVAALGFTPRLGMVVVGENPASKKFVELKERFATSIGCDTRIYEIEEEITTNALRVRMKDIVHEGFIHGIIVQLPLPPHIDAQSILNTITPQKDVDVLSARAVGDFEVGKSKIMPPVVGAVKALFDEHQIALKGKKTVAVGYGKLVGKPLAAWAAREGAILTIISDPEHFDPNAILDAEIIFSGVGRPQLITGDMIREGAVVVDVGTSEQAGKLVGDVDFDSASRVAAFITPPTGGVGPLTVAMVFTNLITLLKSK